MSVEALEIKISKVEKEISDCDEEIRQVTCKADAENEVEERKYLRQKEEQLRKDKEQLRKKEEQLRDEKKLIRQAQDAQVGSTPRNTPACCDAICCLCRSRGSMMLLL